jgi:hypothetical protein
MNNIPASCVNTDPSLFFHSLKINHKSHRSYVFILKGGTLMNSRCTTRPKANRNKSCFALA